MSSTRMYWRQSHRETGSAVARAGLRTFLGYDFGPKGVDAGTYEDPGWAKAPPAYGPSSAHPNVVIVGFADGSVMALSKKVDDLSKLAAQKGTSQSELMQATDNSPRPPARHVRRLGAV